MSPVVDFTGCGAGFGAGGVVQAAAISSAARRSVIPSRNDGEESPADEGDPSLRSG